VDDEAGVDPELSGYRVEGADRVGVPTGPVGCLVAHDVVMGTQHMGAGETGDAGSDDGGAQATSWCSSSPVLRRLVVAGCTLPS
jgi:hypothetical protein